MACLLELCLNICSGPFLGYNTRASASGEFGKDNGEESEVGEVDDLAGSTVLGSIDQCLHTLATHSLRSPASGRYRFLTDDFDYRLAQALEDRYR